MAFVESDFIRWIREAASADGLPVPLGDDAAVLREGTVLTVDAVVEGVHFDPGTPFARVARKALGRALSDVCAMGAVAEAVVVAALLPDGCDGRTLARALAEAATDFDVVLAGGDTVRAGDGALALTVTATGYLPWGDPWRRAGACVGDRLVVSGPLGGSRAGRHLDVRPRTDLVRALRERGARVHAAIDLSDGLGRDLPRLCSASGVGARIEAARIPVHADVVGADPLQAALGDGEDYELLLAFAPEESIDPGLVEIGCVEPGELRLVVDDELRAWPPAGWEHAF